jgi:hypothetical protein
VIKEIIEIRKQEQRRHLNSAFLAGHDERLRGDKGAAGGEVLPYQGPPKDVQVTYILDYSLQSSGT